LWPPAAAACPCLLPDLLEAPFPGMLLLAAAAAAVLLLPLAGSHGSRRMLHDSSGAAPEPVTTRDAQHLPGRR
jgi:hypothetical protein